MVKMYPFTKIRKINFILFLQGFMIQMILFCYPSYIYRLRIDRVLLKNPRIPFQVLFHLL